MNVNREYKNNLFTALFDNVDKARELYAALKGIACGADDTPDQWEEHLADAFIDPEGDGKNTLTWLLRCII
jgi:hypothetical protein